MTDCSSNETRWGRSEELWKLAAWSYLIGCLWEGGVWRLWWRHRQVFQTAKVFTFVFTAVDVLLKCEEWIQHLLKNRHKLKLYIICLAKKKTQLKKWRHHVLPINGAARAWRDDSMVTLATVCVRWLVSCSSAACTCACASSHGKTSPLR